MIWATASAHAALIGLGLAVAIMSLTVDIIFRPRLTAGEGGIDG
jgi:hypothetical protein